MAFDLAAFTPRARPEEIDDLRRRLRATRWPDAPEDAGWSLGTDLTYLRDLTAHWADGFDWPAWEASLARHPRFRATVGGDRVHFIHARARPGARPMPLILCHGWPDSTWRYTRVIDLLTDPAAHGGDPADAFDVIVPDMPGFGFSDRPRRPLNSIEVAARWAELATGLGYDRFGVAGGDIGSHVARYLALNHPDRVVAVHRTDGGLPSPSIDPATLSPAEQEWIRRAGEWATEAGAYMRMHVTRPQTAGFGLTDSPAGLAAWIVEKLHSWSDPTTVYAHRDVLALLNEYWFPNTITASMRMYHANAAIPPAELTRRVTAPSGFALFPADIAQPPREWLERSTNLVHLTHPPRGGHFAAFEQPSSYAQDLRTFFRPFRE